MANVTIDGKPLGFDSKGAMEVAVGSDTYIYKVVQGGSIAIDLGAYEMVDYAYKNIAQTPYRGPFQGATLTGTLFLAKPVASEATRALTVFSDTGASTTCEPTLIDITFKFYDCDGSTVKLTIVCNDLFVVNKPVIRAGGGGNGIDTFEISMKTMVEPTVTYAV